MIRFLLLTAVFCAAFSAAVAKDTHMWGPTAYVTIQPSTRPGVLAEVHFVNDTMHTMMVETFDLTLGDLTVSVRIDAQLSMEPETMTVTPPAGYIAYPPEVTVPEGGAGVVLILEDATS